MELEQFVKEALYVQMSIQKHPSIEFQSNTSLLPNYLRNSQ
jgi:hypothetical protein